MVNTVNISGKLVADSENAGNAISLTIIITIALVILVLKNKYNSKLFNTSMFLIIGGGIANLIDRIFLGYVIDYLSISFFPPVCNFADYCISIGAVLLVIYILFYSEKKDKVITDNEWVCF